MPDEYAIAESEDLIATWAEAATAMHALRLVRTRRLKEASVHDARAQRLAQKRDEALMPLVEEEERLERALEAFALAHRDEFEGEQRSREVAGGRLGLASNPPRYEFALPEGTVIARLAGRGHNTAVRVKTSVDKRALRGLSEAELKACGVRVVASERVVLELD